MDYFKQPALSNSAMKLFHAQEGGSPQQYQAYLRGEFEKSDSLSLERGSLLHLAMLEPEKFVTQTVDTPSGMLGDFVKHLVNLEWEHRIDHAAWLVVEKGMSPEQAMKDPFPPKFQQELSQKAYERTSYKIALSAVEQKFQDPQVQAYYHYLKESRDKISLTQDDRRVINTCIQNLHQHPVANRLLLQESDEVLTWNEQEVYWIENIQIEIPNQEGDDMDIVIVQVPCKAKLDRIRYHAQLQVFQEVDLKTTANGLYSFSYSQQKFRYYRQHAFYQRALQAFAQQNNLPYKEMQAYNVVVETNRCFEVGVYPYTDAWIAKGIQEYQQILQDFAWHQHTGKWDYPREYYENNGYLSLLPPADGNEV